MEELFRLRWEERNRVLQQEFLQVQQEMNSRGLLNSSMTIQNAHEALKTEFESNRLLISKTIIDHIKPLKRIARAGDFEEIAQNQLLERKQHLERSLEGEFANVLNGLQNAAMIAPFRNLNPQFELASRELTVELTEVINNYNQSFGNSLTAQLRTQFLNYPILAVVVLSAAGTGFLIGLLRLVGVISFE